MLFTTSIRSPRGPGSRCRGLWLLPLLLLAGPAARASWRGSADDPSLSEVARSLSGGHRLEIVDLFLESAGVVTLDLERFEVFATDAVIRAGNRMVTIPETAYYRGVVTGHPDSRVVLGFRKSGHAEGLITSGGEVWRLSSTLRLAGVGARRLDVLEEFQDRPFECLSGNLSPESSREEVEPLSTAVLPEATVSHSYSARIAVETDWEFLQKFGGDVSAGTDYVGDLFAFASTIYEDEVSTSLFISYLQWWPGPDAAADPWGQSGCSELLGEFRSYWLANQSGIERTVAHFLSGKSTGCGIAYLSALCSSWSGYGVSGSLSGGFDPSDPTSSSGFWDILVVSHELGHNFGSHHTHCYEGLLGNPEPVDQCYSGESGCYVGTTSLPGCSPGGRCGTIMSYCHLRSGGYGNIALTFGTDHAFGEDPWRVPAVMSGHVASRAGSYPTCLSPISDSLFEDGFDSGTTGAWSEVQP